MLFDPDLFSDDEAGKFVVLVSELLELGLLACYLPFTHNRFPTTRTS